jgi:V8-like Glu-specific endopeptidase
MARKDDEFRVLPINNPIDERTDVSYPSICKLLWTNRDGKPDAGTGFLIDSTKVVTAGHCVDGMESIEVFFPDSGIKIQAEKFKAFGAKLTPKDLGIILMSKPCYIDKYITLRHSSSKDLKLQICGYPAGNSKCLGMLGPAKLRDDGFYYYTTDTTEGQSGGPALIENTLTAIGVHVGFGGTDGKNRAAPFSSEFIKDVKDFR